MLAQDGGLTQSEDSRVVSYLFKVPLNDFSSELVQYKLIEFTLIQFIDLRNEKATPGT